MHKINYKTLIITCLTCLLPIILGIYYLPELPHQLAVHWGINNNPNGYMIKEYFIIGFPLFMMLIEILLSVITDLFDNNPEANKKTMTILKWVIPIINLILYPITILYNLGHKFNISNIALLIVSILLIVLGNYIPKTKNSIHIGFKRIEFKNDVIERKITHALGYTLIINGILLLLSIPVNNIISFIIIMAFIIESIIIAVYTCFKIKQNERE